MDASQLNIPISTVFLRNYQSKKRININRGGTSSGKTGSLIDLAVLFLFAGKVDEDKYFEKGIFSIVRKYSANLRTSVQRDFEDHLNTFYLMNYVQVNRSEKTYTYQGRVIEFMGIDDPQKARGPRRDILWCNEANELTREDFFQLSIRTRYKIFIDFNPSDEDVWINTDLEIERMAKVGDVAVIISTYLDNPFLDEETVREIELLAESNPSYWRVYGLWEYGKLEGLIFNINIIDDVPEGAKFIGYGQDFGYTNDPSTLMAVYLYNGAIILHEIFYKTKLLNQDIVTEYENNKIEKYSSIWADSSEPKSIAEIQRYGYNIKGAVKWKDSIKFGIDVMLQYTIYVTRSSTNAVKEFRKYCWKLDKDGKPLNEPVKGGDHTIDAARYACVMSFAKQNKKRRARAYSLADMPSEPLPDNVSEFQGITNTMRDD